MNWCLTTLIAGRLSFLLAAQALAMSWAPAYAEQPRRNVLLIMADDLNCDLGCYGQALVKTPQIDRLAGQAVRFDRAYCQYPVCNPSRVSMLSGRRPQTTRVVDLITPTRSALGDARPSPGGTRQLTPA